jgi:hypothetical protein
MYQLTLTSLRYGDTDSTKEYYAKNDIQLANIKNHLFDKETIETAAEIEYSINNKECTATPSSRRVEATDDWNKVYWTFEQTDDVSKWGYSLEIKPIKFGV